MRTRRRTRHDGLLILAMAGVLLTILVLQELPLIVVIGAVATGAYMLGRHHGMTLATGRAPRNVVQIPRDRRAERNGWIEPPARTVLLSAACAGADCGICTDRTCQHGCGHPALHRSPPAQPQTRSEVPF